jgi:hypothetical protein
MTKKLNSLTVLFIVTIVMVVLMMMTIQRPNNVSEDYSILFPELFEQLSAVDTIKFKSSQDEFTLYKNGEDWFIKEHWNFPADFNLVKRAMIDIAESKILERKTDNVEHHILLGVEGVEEGGESIQVTMLNGEQQVAGLLLGMEREIENNTGPRQFFVRQVNDDRVWLAEGYLNISPLMLNWIKSEVLNIDRSRIAQVNIIQPNGETATIVNVGVKDKFGVPGTMEKTVFKYDQLGYDIAGTLNQLRMEDVQPLEGFSRGDSEVVTAEFITFDGLKVITKTSFIDGSYYTRFKAEYDESVVKQAPEDIQELDVLKTAEIVKQEAVTITEELKPWVYRFGGFVGTNMMRAEADIVTKSGQAIPMPADLTGVGQ